jgi:hypothetical protein
MICRRLLLFTTTFFLLAVVLSGSLLVESCNRKADSTYTLTGDTIADGKNLVQIHCTKCHALVPVNALTNDVWQYHTLPSMARYFGMTPYLNGYFKTDKDTARLTLLEWQDIVAYYKKVAPDSLPAAKPPVKETDDWAGFVLKTPSPVNGTVYTTMAIFDPFNKNIYTSDGLGENLVEWNSNLKIKKFEKLPSPAVNASFSRDSAGHVTGKFSCIGRLEPIDFPDGKVMDVDLTSQKANQNIFVSDLARPVQTISADFNKDGLMDWVILGQGNLKGGVYLFKQNTDHTYSQTNISDRPGAVQAVAGDFNNDGWQDLMILFGTGDEGLWLYLNDHKGGFITKNLLRFPPVYGSSSFQLADMDHDGKPDLIYTSGYNFRDSRILKPYHGLYIFKNMGNWNFKQQWFYPINGCTKAIAADFDGDGDLDIATSAFFADMKDHPSESFIYFEQDKPFSFKPHAVPISKYGRWISMDVGDVNNDSKPDIILGNYSSGFMFQRGLKPFWAKNIPFVILENHLKK